MGLAFPRKTLLAVILVSTLVTVPVVSTFAISSSVSGSMTRWAFIQGCSYQIYTDGTNYYSRSCDTGTLTFSGTDARTVFRNTISVLSASGGGKILVKAGTYSITGGTIAPASNIIIQGEGVGNTVFIATGTNGIFNKNNATPMSNFMISDMTLDGNNKNQQIINFGNAATNFKIVRIYAKNAGNNFIAFQVGDVYDSIFDTNSGGFDMMAGVYTGSTISGNTFKNGGAQGLTSGEAQNVTITNNIFQNIATKAISMESIAGNINNLVITNNRFISSGSSDIQLLKNTGGSVGNVTITNNIGDNALVLGTGGPSAGNIIVGNTFKQMQVSGSHNLIAYNRIIGASSAINAAIYLSNGVSDTRIVGNYIAEAQKDGIQLENADNTFVSKNIIVNNGRATDNTYSGIHLINFGASTPDNNVITENTIIAATSGNKAKYGIDHTSGSNNIVADNQIVGTYGTSAFNLAGSGASSAFVHYNKGFVTENTFTSGTFDIASTGVKTVTTNHGLNYTPATDDCKVTVIQDTAVADGRVSFVKISSTTSTTITVKVNVLASATPGATAKLGFVCTRG